MFEKGRFKLWIDAMDDGTEANFVTNCISGFAYCDKPDVAPEAGYTDTHYAEDIRTFLDFHHFDKIRIVTHDAGAAWVPRFARMAHVRSDDIEVVSQGADVLVPSYQKSGQPWMSMSGSPAPWRT